MSFPVVAIDFETANPKRGSACAVGLAKFDADGKLVDTFYSLLKPHNSVSDFAPINVGIHGISEEDVANAPEWDDIFGEISAFVGGLPLIAHNAPFERSVLRELEKFYSTGDLSPGIACTLDLSRCYNIDLDVHKLTIVHRKAFGKTELKHHNAIDDALMCGQIFFWMLKEYSIRESDIEWYLQKENNEDRIRKTIKRINRKTDRKKRTFSAQEIYVQVPDKSILAGETVCFTGKFDAMIKKELGLLVESLSGKTESGVTRKTSILVLGSTPTTAISENKTSKAIKAEKLKADGQHISIISENQFFNYILGT